MAPYSFFWLLSGKLMWSDHGQETLESAHICLVTGADILKKNLVRPGIDSFTIMDGNQISR